MEKRIDWSEVERLCSLFCTDIEISEVFGMTVEELRTSVRKKYGISYEVFYGIHSSKGKIALREKQLQLAEKNVAMATFLGKEYLSQGGGGGISSSDAESLRQAELRMRAEEK